MNDKEKLRFLSHVLEGPLRVMGVTGKCCVQQL